MPNCIICNTTYYRQTELEPYEPCMCGECAWGTLWGWNGLGAYMKYLRYRLGDFLFFLGRKVSGL